MGGGGNAADHPAQHQQPDRPGHRHQQIIQRHDKQRHQQHRPASVVIRQVADNRAEQELHHRKHRRHHPAPKCGIGQRAALHFADQVGHDRHDQPNTHGIKHHCDKQKQNWQAHQIFRKIRSLQKMQPDRQRPGHHRGPFPSGTRDQTVQHQYPASRAGPDQPAARRFPAPRGTAF